MIKTNQKKPKFELWEVIVISLIASLIMSLSTGYVVYRSNAGSNCKKVADSKYIGEFVTSYNNILNNYYDKVDQSALIDAAINGMLSHLGDPYTTYLDENNTSLLTDSLNGTYDGIGVEVKTNSEQKLEIAKVFNDSPASKAGVAIGDIITSINGTDVTAKSPSEAVDIIKSSNDKKIVLVVSRNAESLTFNLEKANLFVPSVEGKTYEQNNKKIGYIAITKFSDSVTEQFKTLLQSEESENINGLIIDLRNNTGGYLNGATKIASMFLENGKVIYSLQNKLSTDKTKDETSEKRTYKVYILINKGSASASEILAAALKYSYGSTLVGEKSYGKGKVQKTSTLSDGSMYKYTSAKWLTPNGDCIDGIGLSPDINVTLSDTYSDNPTIENDNQFQTALYEISK